jgi:hypothetical protein
VRAEPQACLPLLGRQPSMTPFRQARTSARAPSHALFLGRWHPALSRSPRLSRPDILGGLLKAVTGRITGRLTQGRVKAASRPDLLGTLVTRDASYHPNLMDALGEQDERWVRKDYKTRGSGRAGEGAEGEEAFRERPRRWRDTVNAKPE